MQSFYNLQLARIRESLKTNTLWASSMYIRFWCLCKFLSLKLYNYNSNIKLYWKHDCLKLNLLQYRLWFQSLSNLAPDLVVITFSMKPGFWTLSQIISLHTILKHILKQKLLDSKWPSELCTKYKFLCATYASLIH